MDTQTAAKPDGGWRACADEYHMAYLDGISRKHTPL
jgi:hypothetical protein